MTPPIRQCDRYRLDGRVNITVFRSTGKSDCWGRISDVSEAGMGATVAGDLEPGEFVLLQFSLLSSSHMLELRARVCYRCGYYFGFEFLVVSEVQREQIKRTCERLPIKDSREDLETSWSGVDPDPKSF